LFPLREAARAAAAGDLQALSLYLNAWTTLQYPTFLTDPDRILVRQLLEGNGNRLLPKANRASKSKATTNWA
jgi:5-formyltetrahydrofolate cyclo-ligase